jgi:3-deoxy-D-manno-octulosonic-acid transferase
MNSKQKIVIIAPNIPQVYVTLALLPLLKRDFNESDFLVVTAPQHFHHFNASDNCELISSLPRQQDLLMALYIGHSFFIKDELLYELSALYCTSYWINAHFEQEDLSRWRDNRNLGQMLTQTFSAILYENSEDQAALQAIGFAPDQLYSVDNAKYDCAAASPWQITTAKQKLKDIGASDKTVIVAGSIVDGLESDLIISAFKTLSIKDPELKFVLAPRNLDHVDAISKKLLTSGFSFQLSSQHQGPADPQVLLVNQVGLLKGFFYQAFVAVMGRSFYPASSGGSNIIEPAVAALPILTGPFMTGFKEILENFKQDNALLQLDSAEDLLASLQGLLSEPEQAKAYGLRAQKTSQRHSGALHKTSELLARIWHFDAK